MQQLLLQILKNKKICNNLFCAIMCWFSDKCGFKEKGPIYALAQRVV
jgi:hypothetical protein